MQLMQPGFSLPILSALCGLLLISCKNYSVSVNDNTVYTPAPLFNNYQVADPKLHDCITQTIYDLHITKAEELTRLNCSNAGIVSLQGLDRFFALAELNLTNNQITDITALGKLGRLEVLLLNNNQINTSTALLNLLHLQKLDLTMNPALACRDLYQLADNLKPQKPELILPEQCR